MIICYKKTITADELYELADRANENNEPLYLRDLTSLPEGVNLTVGRSLYLSSLTSLPEGVSLTVGGSLELSSLTSLPEGVSLTVGESLYLSSLTSLPEGVNLTVDGWLVLRGGPVKHGYKKLREGDYVLGEYLYADGILTHVKRDKRIGAYTYYVGKIPGRDVISDGTHYAHCGSVRDGISELAFKTAKDRGAEQYRSVDIGEEIPTGDAIVMYRVITGACQQGTKRFVDSLPAVRDRYTVRQIIDMTRDQYGGEAFRRLFEG